MSNRELLSLAAKAAGYQIWWKEGVCKGGEYEGAFIGDWPWNPLIDDGDAFRLIVALNCFEPYKSRGGFRLFPWSNAEDLRRGIVVAAAEIGKTV